MQFNFNYILLNLEILNTNVQDFITDNLRKDISKIIFKGSPFCGVTIQEIANQIVAKKKSEKKLPTWFHTKNIYFPEKISIEQTSSEITAKYKSELTDGESLIDLSGGFGVDSFYFSKKIPFLIHCEIDENLSKIVEHNFKLLDARNIKTVAANGISYLNELKSIKFDWIYLDPSRRDTIRNKVFLLKDCAPNVPEILDELFLKTNNILLKVSPILDITATIKELKYTKEIHIVSVQNEVKELLFVLEKGYSNSPEIITIDIHKSNAKKFSFNEAKERETISLYAAPLTYLYEPNAAILKSGGFHSISNEYKLYKLQEHSHLYTSKHLIDFPGRIFRIQKVIPYQKKSIKKELTMKKANITVRNFPKSVEQLRKETKLADGGYWYLFFTTLSNHKKVIIICEKET